MKFHTIRNITRDRKVIFLCNGIGYGRYFIGVGSGEDATIDSLGLVRLIWKIYIGVPYKYRKRIRAIRQAI